jgi:hypothetical protein
MSMGARSLYPDMWTISQQCVRNMQNSIAIAANVKLAFSSNLHAHQRNINLAHSPENRSAMNYSRWTCSQFAQYYVRSFCVPHWNYINYRGYTALNDRMIGKYCVVREVRELVVADFRLCPRHFIRITEFRFLQNHLIHIHYTRKNNFLHLSSYLGGYQPS